VDLLGGLELGDAEEVERAQILDAWAAWTARTGPFRPEAAPLPGAPPRAPTGMAAALEALDAGDPALVRMRLAAEGLLAANDLRVTAESGAALRAGDRARSVARLTSIASLAVAIVLGWALWASIAGPLQRLTRGTRELARGRFDHRIDDRSRSEFGTLARDFNHMAERLGELEELKQDFVSHVSHELKGPLAAVQETILVLLEELPGSINERQRHLLELSEGSAKRLSRMIGNLLEMSRLEAGAALFDPTPLLLPAVVRDVVEENEPIAADREQVVEVEDGVSESPGSGLLVGDGDRLREVVANLVGNALKFSPEGGRIRIGLDALDTPPVELPPRYRELRDRESGPFLRMVVEDEGTGVTPEHREGVFEKFYQVRIDGRKTGQGVGLGLAISRRIVEGHGGAIWCEGAEGGGARFVTLLPVRPSRWPELAPVAGDEAQADLSDAEGRTMIHA
jgi:two-component system, NtrC family, sensor histidine kinase GlrK